MTQAEAGDYTRDSYYEGRNFDRGTSSEAAAIIISKGARLTSDRVNTYGDGFYFSFTRSKSEEYARLNPNPAVITARVSVKNPRNFRDSIEFEDFLIENNISADDLQAKAVTKLLISQGFDAIEIGGSEVLVIIFDRRQIAVFDKEEL